MRWQQRAALRPRAVTFAARDVTQQTRTYRSATLRGPSTWCIHNKLGGLRQAV